jgi:hypothetical protein
VWLAENRWKKKGVEREAKAKARAVVPNQRVILPLGQLPWRHFVVTSGGVTLVSTPGV